MATFYVDALLPGNDSFTIAQAQNQATPWRTIQHGFSVLSSRNTAGDTLLVKRGTYAESPSLTGPLQGTQANPITFANFPGDSPVIDASSLGVVNCVNLNSAGTASQKMSWVVFQGFEVRGAFAAGIKFGVADHCTIRLNNVHDNGNNVSNPESGILGRGTFITIDRNITRHNGYFAAPNNQGHGMYLIGTHYTVTNNIVDQDDAYGIQCAGYPFNAAIDPDATYSGFANSLLANNTMAYDVNRAGIVLWNNGGGCDSNTVVNNIFYENSQALAGTSEQGISFTGTTTNNTITNNVAFATAPGGLVFAGGGGLCSSCTITNNHGGDLSLVNPNMVNAPATRPTLPDFHLTAGSVAIGFGLNLTALLQPLGANVDFDGVLRPATGGWDVGAYQFGGSGPTPPSVPQNLRIV